MEVAAEVEKSPVSFLEDIETPMFSNLCISCVQKKKYGALSIEHQCHRRKRNETHVHVYLNGYLYAMEIQLQIGPYSSIQSRTVSLWFETKMLTIENVVGRNRIQICRRSNLHCKS